MSNRVHMKGYNDLRTLYQIDSLYAWKHDRYFPPVIVEISPTHKCNQLCRYCYSNKRGKPGDTLRDEILISSFTQIADAGVQAVEVQGTGEPLMHKALPTAIEAGAKRGLSIGLTTNGVLLNKSLQERTLEHLFYVKFSVIDSNPQRYAYLHGCSEKQWENLVSNIENAVILRKKNNLQLALFATAYLSDDNFKEAYNIVKFYKETGLDYIVVQEATYNDFSPAGKASYASDGFSETEINEMREKLLTLDDDDFVVKIRFPINDETFFVGIDKESWKSNFCQGIKFSTTIASDGEVYPCWRMWGKKEFSYGSMYEKSFEEIWKGERRKEIEEFIFSTPPCGSDAFSSECNHCNITKLNEILYKYQNANTKWIGFLLQ